MSAGDRNSLQKQKVTLLPEQPNQVGSGTPPTDGIVQYYFFAEETRQLQWIHMSHIRQAAAGGASLWTLMSICCRVRLKRLNNHQTVYLQTLMTRRAWTFVALESQSCNLSC